MQPPPIPTVHRIASHSEEVHSTTHSSHPIPGDRTMPVMQSQHSTGRPFVSGGEQVYSSSAAPDQSIFPSAIKLLVSNNMAGSIIGRSGQTISELQAQSSTRIKLSQTGDYFPGTQDRVCLVQGQANDVKKATSLLLSRLYALQQQHYFQQVSSQQELQNPGAAPDHLLGVSTSFSFVVRILVPSPSCGMIIGKGGTNIKQMVDTTGVSSVRLSPKEGPDVNADSSGTSAALASATSERVVTITGPDLNSCIMCIFMILDGMTSHPDICRYANMTTSYSRVMSVGHAYDAPGAGATLAGPPGSQESLPRASGSGLWDSGFIQQPHPDLGLDLQGARSFDTTPPSPSIHRSMSGPCTLPSGFAQSPSSPHFRPQESMPPYSPMLGGHVDLSAGAYQPSPARIPRSQSNSYLQFAGGRPSPLMGMNAPRLAPSTASASAPDLLALQFQESLRMSDTHRSMMESAPFAPGAHPGFTVQVAIPDSLIGSILGRGGQTLNELQMQSNTRIRISQRGEYVPGTKNRIVTIRGPTAQSVTMAQFLMSQRMVLPPTAVSPTTAFPIQPVERDPYERMMQGGSYMPPPGTPSHEGRHDPYSGSYSPHFHQSS